MPYIVSMVTILYFISFGSLYTLNIWVLRPFQEYSTYIEPIINQRWAKTGVPGEKPPDLPVQNLASHMCPGRGSNHSSERSNVYESAALTTRPRRPVVFIPPAYEVCYGGIMFSSFLFVCVCVCVSVNNFCVRSITFKPLDIFS